MARSGESFSKKEKQKKRLKDKQDKREKMEERKANAKKGKSLDEMMAYLDENGNLTTKPPDPARKMTFNAEDIQIGVPRYEEEEQDPNRTGTVAFFNEDKGFGFINDAITKERVFVHIKSLSEPIYENDKVSFQIENGPKGPVAVQVKKA